jgi:hypothetical protein
LKKKLDFLKNIWGNFFNLKFVELKLTNRVKNTVGFVKFYFLREVGEVLKRDLELKSWCKNNSRNGPY